MEFNVESPLSFDLGDDLFPLPPLPSLPSSSISPLFDNGNGVSRKPKTGRQKRAPANTPNDNGDEIPEEQRKKKIMHRDGERQRRQEMSSLYNTLRSLLPLEYLKGKRSISDHIHETVNYIQHMQGRIKQLSDKGDELRKLSDKNTAAVGTAKMLSSSERDSVVVRDNKGLGIEVVIDTATKHRLPLSNFLQALAAEELQILSCNSTKRNERFIHTIECQPIVGHDGCTYPSIDLSQLHHKLTNLEYYPLD